MDIRVNLRPDARISTYTGDETFILSTDRITAFRLAWAAFKAALLG